MPRIERGSKAESDRKQIAPSTWFLRDSKEEAAKALVEWSDESILDNGPRASRTYMYSSAYEGYTISDLRAFGADVRSDLVLEGIDVPIYVNRIRSQSATFVALTGANDNVVPQFVTNGADYDQALAAEMMGDVVTAEYAQRHGAFADFHSLCRKLELMVTSALGRGWVFVSPQPCLGGEKSGQRIKPEAEIDDGLTIGIVRECQYGRILTLTRSSWKDPEWMIARYHEHKDAILANVEFVQPNVASGQSLPAFGMNAQVSPIRRLVRLIQGWHVSTGPKDPGRETFTLKDGTWLCDSVWTRSSPPGRYIDYEEELSGEGGTPLTHTIYRLFCRENEMLHDADQLERNTPMAAFLVQKGTGDASDLKKQLENAQGLKIIEVPGDVSKAIKAFDLGAMPRKTMELMAMYAQLQHEIPGISRSHADSTQPKNVSSGIQASLEASLFPERHADFVQRFSHFRAVECAELFVWAIQDIVEDGESYEMWAGDEGVKRKIKGNELDLDLSKYVVEIKPSSDRKDSVATRMEKAERWLQDPLVQFTGADMAQFWKTYDVGHFTQELDAITSGVRRQIKKWRSLPLERAKQEYRSPAKWMTVEGLESALRTVVSDYEYARDSKVPQDRLNLWENYMNQCVGLIRALRLEEAQLLIQAQQQAAGGMNGTRGQPGAGGPASAGPGQAGPAV